jgi:hypothetical protein
LGVIVSTLALVEGAARVFRVRRNDIQVGRGYVIETIRHGRNILESLIGAVVINRATSNEEFLPGLPNSDLRTLKTLFEPETLFAL